MKGKILLVVPPVRLSVPPTRFPLGLAYLAASLEKKGFQVSVLDLNILRLAPGAEEERVRDELEGVDLVATGGMITMLNALIRIAGYVDKYRPGLPVIVGGPVAACLQEQILRKSKITALVAGEGEMVGPIIATALIQRSRNLREIPGLAFLENDQFVFTPPSRRIEDLDSLPMPAYHLFPFYKYLQNRKARSSDIIGSRGCPFKCTFCFRNFGNKVVFRSVESIIEEIRFLKNFYSVHHIHLEDELFVQRKDFLSEFCFQMRKLSGINWSACARVNTVSLEILKEMKNSGCKALMIGIESFSDDILNEMKKGTSVEQVDRACIWMNKVGIEIWPGLIIGMPGETKDTVRLAVDGCIRHNIKINEWSYAFATPYPGTELYAFAKEKGIITNEWEYVQRLNEVGDTNNMAINLTKFSDAELIKIRQQAIQKITRKRCRGTNGNRADHSLFSASMPHIPSILKKIKQKGNRFKQRILPYKRKNPFSCVQVGHFDNSLSAAESKALFQEAIRMVEIEVFSFCNRTCWFCPNSYIDRRSKNQLMSQNLYSKILENLQEINYKGTISYSRYNEPLADPIIFDRLKQARDRVPQALLHFNTNGDYFNKDILHKLYDSGLRSLNIQVYTPEKRPYSDELATKFLMERLKKYALPYEFVLSRPMDWLEYRLLFKDMNIRIYTRNFRMNGTDRGATVPELSQEKIRQSPCLVPFTDIYIDFNGNVVPCCNIRSDIGEHSDFVIGDLNDRDQSVFTVFQSPAAAAFRKKLVGFHEKCYPCDRCNFAQIVSSPANIKRADTILRR